MTAWVIRAGRHGERQQWCLDNGVAGVGWEEVGDLSGCSSRADVVAAVNAAYAGTEFPPGTLQNWASQLWGLVNVAVGDIVILPLKPTGTVAFGVCTRGYQHPSDGPLSHVVSVDWKRDDIPRTAIKGDLLATLGAIQTVFAARRHEAEARFKAVMEAGVDPGSNAVPASTSKSGIGDSDPDVVDPVTLPTVEAIRDRIRTFVSENFKGHRLTELVAAILRVRGFVCEVSPPGADQGVDILAGRGPLGLDSPTLIVEVKSEETQVKAPVVRGLQGAMMSNRADQGLLVAWGGITKDAKNEIRKDRLMMRVWDADNLLDHLLDVYPQLPDAVRLELPLKNVWVLEEEAG